MKYLFLLAAIIVSLSACNFTSTSLNRTQDLQEGKKFVDKFYNAIKAQNNKALDHMAADTLKKLIGPNGISKITTLVYNKAGNYKSYTVTDAATRNITGNYAQTQYKFKLKVVYEKGVVNEDLGFIKMGSGEARIFAYHAYSDLLMK